jgi:type II protein arginine methyltransferase
MRGEVGQAEMLARQVLAHDPRHAGALVELGRIAHRSGNKRAAADWLRQAIASQPDNVQLHNQLAFLLIELGEREEALRAITRALEVKPNDADAITNRGSLHLRQRELSQALAAYRRALQIDPLHLNARLNIHVALRDSVPSWHFPMMNDGPRSAAYDEAIRRVAKGRSVLDVGTGAGLLAMMAARAEARWVASCELVPWVAAKASEVVAANGLSERIKLFAKRSADLRIGPDLPERAEVLVAEVFGTGLLNEHVIPTVADAHARLLVPGATVVPNVARARGYLAGGPTLEGYLFVDRAAGFTLAPFNDFAPPRVNLDAGRIPHDVLSDDFELFRFDFTKPLLSTDRKVIDVVAEKPGRCIGIVQWLRLDLADEICYENRPRGGASIDGWWQMIYRFDEAVELKAGDHVRVLAQHNGHSLLISNLRD